MLVLTNPVNSSDTDSVNSSIDQSGQPRKQTLKKTLKKSFSIENLPSDLNGKLYYKNNYFFITTDLRDELINNIPGLAEEHLFSEFYKMEVWLESNGKKTDYKRFIVNWLSKNEYSGSAANDLSFKPGRIYGQN